MGEHALAQHAAENAGQATVLLGGGAVSALAVRWLSKPSNAVIWKKPAVRILTASLIGLLPFVAPKPYAFFAFLDSNVWGALVHSIIRGTSLNLAWWTPANEIFMFVGNPGFYSGFIAGVIVHDRKYFLTPLLCPLYVFVGVSLSVAGNVSAGGIAASLAPTLITMFGPHSVLGFFLGLKVWKGKKKPTSS